MNKKNSFLKVSEKFYSIQGEGKTVGYPAIFLRLGGCNLLCQSQDWVCDSIAVWKESNKINFEDVFTDEEIAFLRKGAHLIITGGEPLLHQRSVIRFLRWIHKEYKFFPFVEIETNGTIMPEINLCSLVNLWNVSPKLGNSGEPFKKRFNEEVLRWFHLDKQKVNWKFVISKEEDVNEFLADYSFIKHDERLSFMPAGGNLEQMRKSEQLVVEVCKQLVIRFCPRLQISIYDQATGV